MAFKSCPVCSCGYFTVGAGSIPFYLLPTYADRSPRCFECDAGLSFADNLDAILPLLGFKKEHGGELTVSGPMVDGNYMQVHYSTKRSWGISAVYGNNATSIRLVGTRPPKSVEELSELCRVLGISLKRS